MIYNFYRNGKFQAALKVNTDIALEYVMILREVTYSMWTARRVK